MIEFKSESIKEITKAMIKFHGEVGKVSKNSTNPYFKSKYGDLNAYLDVIKAPLANSGLALFQMPVTNGLRTILSHESGEYIESEMTIPNLPNDPQKVGAALTYMRRYMIASILGLNAEDNDGNEFKKEKTNKSENQHLKETANYLYKQVKNPSDELKTWISLLNTYDNRTIYNGITRINNILKEEKNKG
jgi:hypothetical protein